MHISLFSWLTQEKGFSVGESLADVFNVKL